MLHKAKRPGPETPTGDVLLAGERPGSYGDFEGWAKVLAAPHAISMPRAQVVLWHLCAIAESVK